jgi:hypothetical protein
VKYDLSTRYADLTKHKQSQATNNLHEILLALRELKNAQVRDILKFLRKIRENEFKQICLTGQNTFTLKDKEEYVKKHTINRRTIYNHLDYLIQKKFVERTGKEYALTDIVVKDVRYWARMFGDGALNMLMSAYWPQIFKLERNVDELIKIFGIYMISCFLEASRPVMDSNHSTNKLSTMERDRLIDSWISEMFNPWIMFNYFLAVANNILDDEQVQEIWNKNIKGESGQAFFVDDMGNPVRPASGLDFMDKRFSFLTSKASSYDYTTEPHYELDMNIIDNITKMLKKNYLNYYESISEFKKTLINDPKQEISSGQILDTETIDKITKMLRKDS